MTEPNTVSEMEKRHYDVTKAMLRFVDSDEFREQYGDPPGNLRAHLIKMAGEKRDAIGKENLPLHINHNAPDEILAGDRPLTYDNHE